MTDLPTFTVDRIFDAPRALVWRTWTDPDLVQRWYGPGIETIIHEFDLRPGGVWKNEMKWGGNSDYSKMLFQDVDPMDRLVWHHCSADANWDIAPSMMMPDWPRMLLTTVKFTDTGAKTTVSLSQTPMEATAAEIACFAEKSAGMSGGWGSGYAIIDEMLVELQGEGS